MCVHGPHPTCVYRFSITHIYILLSILLCIDPGTTCKCTQWSITYISIETPITCVCTNLTTYVYRVSFHVLTQGSTMYIQSVVTHAYIQRLERACAYQYPLYLCMQRPSHICIQRVPIPCIHWDPLHIFAHWGPIIPVYIGIPSSHTCSWPLSHVCTQGPLQLVCTQGPVMDTSIARAITGQGHRMCTYRNPFLVYTKEPHHPHVQRLHYACG